jgi:hypothetical protein
VDLNKRLIKRSAFLKMLGGMGVAMTPAASAFAYGGCATGSYYAQYYTGEFFNLLNNSRCEAAPLDNNWGTGKISPLGHADNVSARWTGEFNFQQPGEYEFSATADDGIRVYVDGVRIIDQWKDQPPTTYTARRTLSAGAHEVKVEYYERSGAAVCKLFWARVAPNAPTLPSHAATNAEKFVESMGVGIHMTNHSSPYDNFPMIKAKLIESKLRHIRGGVIRTPDATYNNIIAGRFKELAQAGITTTFNLRRNVDLMPMTPQLMAEIKALYGDSIDMFEGANEYNVFNGGPGGGNWNPNWATDFEEWTKDCFNAIKNNPSTADIPYIAGTLTQGVEQVENLEDYVDYGNFHPYPGGPHPEYGGYDQHLLWARTNFGLKQPAATETGYNTASAHPGGVPESVHGTYIPRIYAFYFTRGCRQTILYEFINQWVDPAADEANFGLLRHDFSHKSAFDAVKNMITIVEDPGHATFSPGYLSYELSGDRTDVHQLLLQKANGDFYLLIWLGVSIYDWEADVITGGSSRSLTLSLANQASSVQVFEPHTSTSPTSTLANVRSVPLTLTEKIKVVRIAAQTAGVGDVTGAV